MFGLSGAVALSRDGSRVAVEEEEGAVWICSTYQGSQQAFLPGNGGITDGEAWKARRGGRATALAAAALRNVLCAKARRWLVRCHWHLQQMVGVGSGRGWTMLLALDEAVRQEASSCMHPVKKARPPRRWPVPATKSRRELTCSAPLSLLLHAHTQPTVCFPRPSSTSPFQ
jgi:hypothetical protein